MTQRLFFALIAIFINISFPFKVSRSFKSANLLQKSSLTRSTRQSWMFNGLNGRLRLSRIRNRYNVQELRLSARKGGEDVDNDDFEGGEEMEGWVDPSIGEWSDYKSMDSTDTVNQEIDTSNNLEVVDVVVSEDFFLAQMNEIVAGELEEIEESARASGEVMALEEAGVPQGLIEEMTGKAVEGGEEEGEMDLDFSRVVENADEEMFEMEAELDYENVESHTLVEKDEDGTPIRSQAVYVDEHTCVGCTMCATVAQSTFFMHPEYGRARVFRQWGDDDETVAIAIDTCPVDCIHYVPYEELERLEVERRGQNINFKARLVSQGEGGMADGARVGGAVAFTGQQQISGNMGSRCGNCPSRGCPECPMYGVGDNPEFKRREEERQRKQMERKMKKEKEMGQKRADL